MLIKIEENALENKNYLIKLCISFEEEILDNCVRNQKLKSLIRNIRFLKNKIDRWNVILNVGAWQIFYMQYLILNRKKAEMLNAVSTVSSIYKDMESFWEDSQKQMEGKSPFTFWDTYEHGRRRQLEQLLANAYESEDAILLNSGMSALTVSIESHCLHKGSILLTTSKNYFETTDYLESFIACRGIKILRTPIENITEAIAKFKPKIVLIETVGNYPETPALENWQQCLSAFPDVTFVIDNTVQSHLTKWFSTPYNSGQNVIVIESATKYITEDIVAGVIYGFREKLSKIRQYARDAGQFLQEKCFNFLSEGLIKNLYLRLLLHSRNVKLFHSIINESTQEKNGLLLSKTLNYSAPGSLIFSKGIGCLIYVTAKTPNGISPVMFNRSILKHWTKLSAKINLSVRAGFGWNKTFVRIYEGGNLNQPDAPNYIRITIGIEPTQQISELAQNFKQAIEAAWELDI